MPCIDTVQGFLFCLATYQPHASIYSGFSAVHAFFIYTSNAKAFTGLYSGFSVDLLHSSAHNTAVTQAAYAPTAPRWRAYHQAQHPHRYQIPPPHRTLYRAGQPPIIIRYIRVQGCAPVMDPCPAVQYSADHASGGGSLHPACIRCRGQYGGWRSGTWQQSGRAGSYRCKGTAARNH